MHSHLARAEGIRQRYPVWKETPTHEAEDTYGFRQVLAYCGDLLSGSEVPAWLPMRIFIEAEMVPQVALLLP